MIDIGGPYLLWSVPPLDLGAIIKQAEKAMKMNKPVKHGSTMPSVAVLSPDYCLIPALTSFNDEL